MFVQVNKIMKNFGGMPLFEKLDLTIQPQEKIGLVGMNGTGKTTLFNILTGSEKVDAGTVSKSKNMKIGYIEQQQESLQQAVLAYIMTSFTEINQLKNQLSKLEMEMAQNSTDFDKVLVKYGKVQEVFEDLGGYQLEDQVMSMLKGLGLAEKIHTSLSDLSGGERVRVELARALVAESDLLLLDEPTNHLDLTGIQWLENYLTNTKKAFIVISHDRAFLDNTVTKIIELEDVALQVFKGNYTRYSELKKIQNEQLQKDYELQQFEILRLKRIAKQFRQWGNESNNEKFFKKAKEIERRIEKIEVIKPPVEPKDRVRKKITVANKTSKEMVKAVAIGKIIGEKLLFADSSFTIFRDERVALMGENGTGKSTLIKMLLGELAVDEGQIIIGDSVKLGYLPQKIIFPDVNLRVVEHAKKIIGNEQKARSELARFGFYASDVSKRVKDLSGGEQVRLALLELFQEKMNLLILDEPTNHLDIYAREEIEDILESYTGTLLVVSHDRYFLQKNLSKTLLIENQQIEKIETLLL